MKSAVVAVDVWKANIVRLPVNEAFWFGRTPYQDDGGVAYRELVDNVVAIVSNRGAYVLLDLHRFRAPKQEHADFWTDAATHFKNHPAVLFDLFNEPHDVSWDVWKSGGFVSEKKAGVDESAFLTEDEKIKANAGFHSVGMQALVDAARATGARNIVIVGGLSWSGDLSGIVNGYALDDKGGNGIIYGWHNYNWHKDWQNRVLNTAEKYPIFVGETGADIKKMTFIPAKDQEDPYTWAPDMIGFIQKYKLNWTAWCLHPKATPILISDWNYTPTPFWGVFVKDALAGKQFTMARMR
jgi:aryl-phospho-beta-D-glucosidase BglC (GH1 family)